MRQLGAVVDLGPARAALTEFRDRVQVVVDQFPTSLLSDLFTQADLAAYAAVWTLVRAAALPGLDPPTQAAIMGGPNDAGNPGTTIDGALAGLNTVLDATQSAGAKAFPWLIGAGVLLTAVVAVVLIRRSEYAP